MNTTLDLAFPSAEIQQGEATIPVEDQALELPAAIARLDTLLAQEWLTLARLEEIDGNRVARWAGLGASCDYLSIRHDAVELIARAAIQATVDAATKLLSKPGAPAKLDIEPYRAQHIGERGRGRSYEAEIADFHQRLRAFRPSHLWHYFVACYSPERVEAEARERAAATIINALDLHRVETIKQVGGRVEICVRLWSEPDHFNKGMRRYSCSSTGQFSKVVEAFATMLSTLDIQGDHHTGLLQMAADLERLSSSNNQFKSRDRDDYPGALSTVKFSEAIKLYFPTTLAQNINLFVSMHGMEHMSEMRSRYRA